MHSRYWTKFSAATLALLISMGMAASAETLRLGGVHSPTSFETKSLERFAELAKKKSGGKVIVQVFPAGQLGDAVSMIENVMIGSQDMFANVSDWNSHISKDYAIMGMPFAFSGIEHVKRFLASDVMAKIKARMIKEKGIRVLADNFYRLPRVLITKQPVKSIADIQGLKLRMANIDVYLETWEALGAKPTVIPWAEAYLALRTGVVEGLDSPLSSIYPQKFYQAAKYVTMTNHSVAPFNILISEKSFQKLSKENQKNLTEAAKEAGDYYTKMIADDFSKQKAAMEKSGVKFNTVDLKPFVERASKVAERMEKKGKWSPGLFKQVRALQP